MDVKSEKILRYLDFITGILLSLVINTVSMALAGLHLKEILKHTTPPNQTLSQIHSTKDHDCMICSTKSQIASEVSPLLITTCQIILIPPK